MIIHAFLTDGFYGYAELFLESLKVQHREDYLVVLCTRDLKDSQVAHLYDLYGNLMVKNESLDIDALSEKWGMDVRTILQHKHQIEKKHITNEARIWKQFTSADQRIRSIYEVMREFEHEDYILHWDIDMYFRRPLDELIDLVYANDICIRFRLHSTTGPHRKVMGGLLGFKINKDVFMFMERWVEYLNAVPIPDRKIGYGQTSLYYTFLDFEGKFKYGDVPPKFISPFMKEEDVVWSANTYKGKTENLKFFRKDFERIKGR